MKQSIYSNNIFEDSNYMLGSTSITSLGQKQYCFSELAKEAWEKTADKSLSYRRSNGKICADCTDSQVVAETGSEARFREITGYVKAFAELPFMVLQDCGITCTEAIAQKLKESYLGIFKWLEFYLLHNVDIVLEINHVRYQKYARRAEYFRALYGLIQEIYADKNELCGWAKAFSPAQLLFCCMIQSCFEDLKDKNLLPGGSNLGKTKCTQGNIDLINTLIARPGQLKIFFFGDEPVVSIYPYRALMITTFLLSQQNIYYVKKRRNPSCYTEYLRIFRKGEYYAKDNSQVQKQRLSSNGETLDFSQRYQQVKSARSRKTEKNGFVKQC